MATSEELATFLVKTAATIAKLDNTLGADDESFRQLAMSVLADEAPVPDCFADLHDQLACGVDPVAALTELFARQSASYTEAGARACLLVVEEALLHLQRAGGDAAVQGFVDDLEAHAQAVEEDGSPDC